MKPDPRGLEELRSAVHPGFSETRMDGRRVPCIVVDPRTYARASEAAGGGALRLEVEANVLNDMAGHVFVELSVELPGCGRTAFVADASRSAGFFELLADSAMFCLAPDGGQSVLGVQLARREGPLELLGEVRKALAGGPAGRGRAG